ncbi:hypothetical protein, partial [Loktanella sp. R86503]|uniref:hypothetical protein n=1 Tax=Loktanella sp. R86503 TaxID=3093847 RepID=UPI0036DB2733
SNLEQDKATLGWLSAFLGLPNDSSPANAPTSSIARTPACGMSRISVRRLRMIDVASALVVSLCSEVLPISWTKVRLDL